MNDVSSSFFIFPVKLAYIVPPTNNKTMLRAQTVRIWTIQVLTDFDTTYPEIDHKHVDGTNKK